MNTTDTALAGLLTGDVVLDAKLREAYSLGVRQGQREPRMEFLIQQRAKQASGIIRAFHCTPLEAVIAMGLTKKDRKPVLKVLETQAKHKENRKVL